MEELSIKISFKCFGNKTKIESELEKIIHYQFYEKIKNMHIKGVKLDVKQLNKNKGE